MNRLEIRIALRHCYLFKYLLNLNIFTVASFNIEYHKCLYYIAI